MFWLMVIACCSVLFISLFFWPAYKADKKLKDLERLEKARDAMRRF